MRIALACASAVILVAPACASAMGPILPDGRAYELVSPPAKHGAEVMGDSSRVRAADDGRAASFASLGGFGDVQGSGFATDYVSERSSQADPGTSGWTTHAINPRQEPQTFFAALHGLDSGWQGDFAPDLATGIFGAWSPVTAEDPNVTNVTNLYLRDDLRTPGAGHYRLLTLCPACSSPFGPVSILKTPTLDGTSADFSHVLFESNLALTPNATNGSPNLYEWFNGSLRLAGILPDEACGTPPCPAGGSTAGGGLEWGSHPISTDGSRITFTDTTTGQIYQRIDGSQTLVVSSSERTDCADHNPCNGTLEPDPSGTQPATYSLASTDGMRVFFTSAEQLTNDDTDTASDLYMWDATRPVGQRLTRISVDRNPGDPPDNVVGVLGAGDSGHDIYFADGGQLVAGKPIGISFGIFAWHDGSNPPITYVGRMGAFGADSARDFIGQGGAGFRVERVTPDGRHLLFMSHSGDGLLSVHGGVDVDQTHCASGCAAFYLYNAESDTLACVSCNPGGASPAADAETFVRDGTGAAGASQHLSRSLSNDGQFVFFNTAEALVPGDANGKTDVYEYDAQTGHVSLISGGTDPSDSFFMDASPDGRNAFFITRQQLVGWDTDPSYDLYDARVGGGFPEPARPAGSCAGDACRGPLSAAPDGPQLGSTASAGATKALSRAVVTRPRTVKCRKGLVRKRVHGKVRCIKQRKRVVKVTRAAGRRRAR